MSVDELQPKDCGLYWSLWAILYTHRTHAQLNLPPPPKTQNPRQNHGRQKTVFVLAVYSATGC